MRPRTVVSAIAVLAAIGGTESTLAQDEEQELGAAVQLPELTVTARHREEQERDVPFAITALPRREIEEQRITDPETMFRYVPGLSLTTVGDGRFGYFQLRGIGPLSQALSPDDASVVTYIDGVPQSSYAADMMFLDPERIEVLKGPQGTLFGRNSQAGVINIITRKPSDVFERSVRLEGGTDRYGMAAGHFSGPVVPDRLYAGISLKGETIAGYVPNTATGNKLGNTDSFAGRMTFVATPDGPGGSRFTLSASGQQRKGNPYFYAARYMPNRPVVSLDPEQPTKRSLADVNLTAEIPLEGMKLTSVSAFNHFQLHQITDDLEGYLYAPLFGLPSSAFLPRDNISDVNERERRYFQEFRLSGEVPAKLAWTTGLNFFRSEYALSWDAIGSFPATNGFRTNDLVTNSYAAFGEATFPIFSPRLQMTVGGRYTRDDKTYAHSFTGNGFPGTVARFAQSGDLHYDLWTGRVTLNWEATPFLNIYGTIARGAKSGGFPRFTGNAQFGIPERPFAPSTSWTYETGLKGETADGRVKYNLAAFYNDIDQEQLFTYDFSIFQFVPTNVDTRSYGLEASVHMLLGYGFELAASASLIEATIVDGGVSDARPGNRTPNVPRFATSTTLGWTSETGAFGIADAALSMSVTHQYVGKRAADVANSFTLPAYHNVDARIGLNIGDMEIYAFGRNLTNATQQLSGILYGPGSEGAFFARGRTVGLGAHARF